MTSSLEDRQRQYLITLVHGTFAREAAWTQEGSVFRRLLEARLGPRLAFSRFNWSGVNSHKARDDAAKELAIHVRELTLAHPDSEHYLVCHSHGGNVALRAVGGNDALPPVRGIITLGTPFITCRPRELDAALRVLGWTIPFSFAVFVMPILAMIIGLVIYWLNHSDRPMAAGIAFLVGPPVGAVILIVSFIKIRRWTKSWLASWILRKQHESGERLRIPELADLELLSLYVKHDEAGAWLNILEFTGNLYHRFHGFNRILIIVCGIALIISVGIVWGAGEEYDLVSHAVSSDIWFLFIPTVVLYVLGGAALGLFPWLIRGHKFGFGGETLFDNMLNRIGVERQPDSVEKSHTVEVTPDTSTGWRHSSFFNDINVSDIVARWVMDRRIDCFRIAIPAEWTPDVARAASLTPYVASLLILVSLALLRWPQYQSAYRLASEPIDWILRFPELDGRLISSESVLNARKYKSMVTKPLPFSTTKGSYCALIGFVRSANGKRFKFDVIRRASFGAYLAGSTRAAYESPDAKFMSLHIPLPEQENYLLRFYAVRLLEDPMEDADISIACWGTRPNNVPVPFQG